MTPKSKKRKRARRKGRVMAGKDSYRFIRVAPARFTPIDWGLLSAETREVASLWIRWDGRLCFDQAMPET